MRDSQTSFRSNTKDSQSDFRIKTHTMTGAGSSVNRLQQPKRTTLMGMSKPHQLSNQNDEIKKMLGMKQKPEMTESDHKPRIQRRDADGNSIISKGTNFSGTNTLQSQVGPIKPVRAGSTIRSNATATNISLNQDNRSQISKHDIEDHWKEAVTVALENDMVDIDSDNVSDYEIDAVEVMMSSL